MQNNIVKSEVVEAEMVEELKPIILQATLRVVIPTPNESMYIMHKSLLDMKKTLDIHTNQLETISNRVMQDIATIDSTDILQKIKKIINKQTNKKDGIDPKYFKTRDAAKYISVDSSFLTKRQGKVFQKGVHFVKPEGESIVRWNIDALTKWLKSEESNEKNIDPKLANLLKRS